MTLLAGFLRSLFIHRETLILENLAVVRDPRFRVDLAIANYPYSAENRFASTGEIFEMPALAERSSRVAISGAEVCSALAKHKSGGPTMHRGLFASVLIVALVGDGPRVLLQAAS